MSLARFSKSIISNNKARLLSQINSSSRTTIATTARSFSDSGTGSITYSGGHAAHGQGGYYGSGGARAKAEEEAEKDITQEQRNKMLAITTDVTTIQTVLEQISLMEDHMREEMLESKGEVTGKSLEIRGKMKHLVSSKEFLERLERLEVEGGAGPKWGLSSKEYALVVEAREKVNSC